MQPFFSVVIPTKNRPFYLRQAIQSVLLQDFHDFELIVSDNFNDEATCNLIREFAHDPRFHSFRTNSELKMCEHWEWASQKAAGKYVLILADRKLLAQNALKMLHQVIVKTKFRFNVYSFAVRMYDEERKRFGYTIPKGKPRIFSTSDLLQNFLSKNIYSDETLDFFFPKSLNSFYRNDWVNTIRLQYGSYFDKPNVTTPDYSSFFINMALNDEVFYFAKYLILTQGEAISTGREIGLGKSSYFETLGLNPFDELPLKIHSSYNLIVNDFFNIKRSVGGNLEGASIDWANYFATNYLDIQNKKKTSSDPESIKQLEDTFEISLAKQSSATQTTVRNLIAIFEQNPKPILKSQLSLGLLALHVHDFLYQRFKQFPRFTNFLGLTFHNGLEAAGFKTEHHY